MRALVDTDILVGYLLYAESPNPPSSIVRAGLDGAYDIVVPQDTIDELLSEVGSKPYLAARIPEELVGSFVDLIQLNGMVIPYSSEIFPRISRDPDDDYVIAHAVLDSVNYIVTGDKDLLVIGEIAGVRIVSPAYFMAILDGSGRD